MTLEEKTRILSDLLQQAEKELEVATRVVKDAVAAATDEEAKAEGDKDMRSTEASYIARGQSGRLRDIEHMVAVFRALKPRVFSDNDRIAVGACVHLEGDHGDIRCILMQVGGGMKTQLGGHSVQVVTVQSPLGSALLGKTEGDTIEVTTQRDVREYDIVEVS